MKKLLLSFVVLCFLCSTSLVQSQTFWQAQYSGLPLGTPTTYLIFCPVNDDICWAVNSDDNTPANQYMRTTNGGTLWIASTISSAPSGWRASYVAALDNNTAWILMHDPSGSSSGGLFKTTDAGENWVQQTTAFPGNGGFPKIIRFFDSNDGICAGNKNGGYWEVYTTSNGGDLWTRVDSSKFSSADPNEVQILGYTAAANTLIFSYSDVGIFSGGYYRTNDRGLNWTKLPISGVPGGFALKDPFNGLMARFVPSNQLFKTTNGGDTFIPMSISLPFTTFSIEYVPGTAGAYVMVSTILPSFPTTPGSAYTLNNGEDWVLMDNEVSRGLFPQFASFQTGWCGSLTDSVYKYIGPPLPVELISFNSSVEGNNIKLNWQTATEINNKGFEIYRNGNRIAFLEGKGTTTETQDYSFVDENLQSGIYNYRLNQLNFNGTQEVIGELTVYLTLPEQFSLEQNFPNPFNPSTTIKYSIPTSSFVTLKVYDVLGNEVATLVNEEKPVGSYEVEFNASNLSSGIYFYTLKAGKYSQTKKLILMK